MKGKVSGDKQGLWHAEHCARGLPQAEIQHFQREIISKSAPFSLVSLISVTGIITLPVSQAVNQGVTLISLLLSPSIQLVIDHCQVNLYSSHLSPLYPYCHSLSSGSNNAIIWVNAMVSLSLRLATLPTLLVLQLQGSL